MPWSRVTFWLTLAFLFGVLVLMALDYPTGTFTVAALPVMMVMLALSWLVLRSALTF